MKWPFTACLIMLFVHATVSLGKQEKAITTKTVFMSIYKFKHFRIHSKDLFKKKPHKKHLPKNKTKQTVQFTSKTQKTELNVVSC